MNYLSVCSGIEAATVAWHPIGWKPLAFSENAKFPRAVLAHHYPDVPLHGDFTKLFFEEWFADTDLLVGGTPCQAFSVAGPRNSLADDRGNLTLEFVRLANAIDITRRARALDPCIIVWENVPGVLSVRDNAFGCFLAALAGDVEPYVSPRKKGKWSHAGLVIGPERQVAWRILDAQFFGVAQRRRRLFVVASARAGFDPGAVLFEREGVRRNSPPRRETPQGSSAGTLRSSDGGCDVDHARAGHLVTSTGDVAHCLNAGAMGRIDYETETMVAHALRAEGFDASEDGTGRGTPIVPVGAPPLRAGGYAVRRLTPTECERLQGFPDGYTDIPKKVVSLERGGPCVKQVVKATVVAPNGTHFVATNYCDTPQTTCPRAGMPTGVGYELCKSVCNQQGHAEVNALKLAGKHAKGATVYVEGHSYACENCTRAAHAAGATIVVGKPPGTSPDGPRYKALGNSMAVPVMRWIGSRIDRHLRGAL